MKTRQEREKKRERERERERERTYLRVGKSCPGSSFIKEKVN